MLFLRIVVTTIFVAVALVAIALEWHIPQHISERLRAHGHARTE